MAYVLVPTLPRGNAVKPLQRQESTQQNQDAGASGLAPTLERGSQMTPVDRSSSPRANSSLGTLERLDVLPRWSVGAR